MFLLIPAAGMGKRMGSDRNKLLLTLNGKPILAWTLLAARKSESVKSIVIIGQPHDFPDFKDIIAESGVSGSVRLITGGDTRQQSVYNGLKALPPEADKVLIHDGARCLATPRLFDRCAGALGDGDGLIAAVPVKDTIKVVDGNRLVKGTPDRNLLWSAQTPQGFAVGLLKDCHEKGRRSGWEVTDDAALFEKCGLPVKIVEGEETNLKVTTPVDLAIAQYILSQR